MSKAKPDAQDLQRVLDESHAWPCPYIFKFIVPAASVDQVEALFEGEAEIACRASSSGKYVSVTCEPVMANSEAVMEIYKKASVIKGLISL